MLKAFLETRLEKWKRLEDLTSRASRYRLTNLSADEVREFGRLYRRTAADLAIAREEVGDRRLINYLNHLVGRSHGAIYRSQGSGFGAIPTFFRYEFPAVFRQTRNFTLAAFLLFLLPALFAFGMCFVDETFSDAIAPGLRTNVVGRVNWTEAINESNPVFSSLIKTNNITVTFIAFAGGVLAGLGTVLVMVQNGILFGVVMGLCVRYSFWDIPIFVTAHGPLELTAIFIAGGSGLLIGKALLVPGDLGRRDALVTNGLMAVKLILGCVPMLVIAGLIEGFISPSKLPPLYKYLVSATTVLLMIAYFGKTDRRPGVEQTPGL